MAMPTTPNGPVYDGDLAHAREEVVELEIRHQVLGSPGAVKLLGYLNHGRMGAFTDALAAAAPGGVPSIDAVARRGALKRGASLLFDQRLGVLAAFLRASWNDGQTEEFAFTQIERSLSLGGELPTDGWGRAGDHVGAAVAVNGLAPAHARYLQAGGVDFQLGDGRLRQALETVLEATYVLHLSGRLELTADLQLIVNPGMNADRGPAVAAGLRLHVHR
jgi:carbohydrate-selective porin OprB